MTANLRALIAAELAEPIAPGAAALAAALGAKGGGTVAAVLFYGSVLRTGDLDGILDFYVVADDLRAWHGPGWIARANGALPPNVEYWELPWQGRTLRAKVAILSRRQFDRAVRADSLDTTIWARFAQPARLAWSRDAEAADWVAQSVADAVATAAGWAARLGPTSGTPADFWNALFRETYATELRVEKGERALHIVDSFPDRYDAVFRPALAQAGIVFTEAEGRIAPALSDADRRAARRAWTRRRRMGKPLNIGRLVKAAFTFTGGVDYLAWKVERHSGVALNLTPWQRRHPILAAPGVLWRLYRQGAVR